MHGVKTIKKYLKQMKLWRKKTEKVKSLKCEWKKYLYLKKKDRVSEAVKGSDLWKKASLKIS